jgi:hypothetical protein
VAKGIHHRIDAAQPVKIPLSVSALAPSHQLLVGAGEGGWRGGDDPSAAMALSAAPGRFSMTLKGKAWSNMVVFDEIKSVR